MSNVFDLEGKFKLWISEIARKHYEKVDSLTKEQFEETLVQMINAGDFVRLTTPGGCRQSVVYLPFADKQRLQAELQRLSKAIDYLMAIDIPDSAKDQVKMMQCAIGEDRDFWISSFCGSPVTEAGDTCGNCAYSRD